MKDDRTVWEKIDSERRSMDRALTVFAWTIGLAVVVWWADLLLWCVDAVKRSMP